MLIELELELADNDAPSITDFNTVYTDDTTSTSWRFENCQLKCAIVSLDNSLDNSYVNHLLGGNTFKVVYDTYISSIQAITSSDCHVHVSRSLTAFRYAFMSLDNTFIGGRVRWHINNGIPFVALWLEIEVSQHILTILMMQSNIFNYQLVQSHIPSILSAHMQHVFII